MNARCYFSIAVAMSIWLFLETDFVAQGQPSTDLTPAGFASRSDHLQSLTNEAAISAAYLGGHISQDEAE